MTQTELTTKAIRFSENENGKEIGHVYLYLLKNDLHKESFGLIEDLFVVEEYRKKGIGKKLIEALIASAREKGCYKLVSTSRYSRSEIHDWYQRLGFTDYGKEFRLDL
ncbi:MAG: GNAT family N-acetyltransferase [Candidatus Magasanikbacteria bacterium RIFCSPHIGHO2_01_FULL_41_23]|uniref:GNAT family N-acetyltransferase n=1 Tax=Candidatus Magasanikbacteria bacterium RIFCSPLOWO2_01_FULL_40_15 TaxID=1798686 RepID=A0A1F6N4D2_9BACT|nr:MAG: GNAT family N-acetyltransferase [Candidatus Magasanikbacteria bacterium RIFCSPHIGHO2_01_FULL_41_23]OGH67205.1 MAG: GNAT family N-acetyltransferase [Candidatus Magasanikbacteria bacterium RIFCSPHIGHO2_02_FULL_41_35]OGH75429.1 MAG: GNAT family N-acetyltransferase [Candidatus Magasanikbacteria bacterium RIFCSPHIGHO2_12_FULL_41_16]OGH78741.1 MAG: GNAT family N-acetyltransferase [Candidatus Magasanikbacteria bacterium RIFCSPLOWO2_01_FULL_40_15]